MIRTEKKNQQKLTEKRQTLKCEIFLAKSAFWSDDCDVNYQLHFLLSRGTYGCTIETY